jgi:hypothetical protein
MRRGWVIAFAIVGILVVAGIAVGAWNAGVDEGIRRGAGAGQIVEVVGRGYGHGGWGFPFGLILFPLFLFGLFWLLGGAFRRGMWGGHGGPDHGPWSDEGRARFERKFDEWHRRQHDQGSTAPDPGGGATA